MTFSEAINSAINNAQIHLANGVGLRLIWVTTTNQWKSVQSAPRKINIYHKYKCKYKCKYRHKCKKTTKNTKYKQSLNRFEKESEN